MLPQRKLIQESEATASHAMSPSGETVKESVSPSKSKTKASQSMAKSRPFWPAAKGKPAIDRVAARGATPLFGEAWSVTEPEPTREAPSRTVIQDGTSETDHATDPGTETSIATVPPAAANSWPLAASDEAAAAWTTVCTRVGRFVSAGRMTMVPVRGWSVVLGETV